MSTPARLVDDPRGDVSQPRLVAALMGLTGVAGIISSLGAPLIPDVARTLHVSLDSAQWSLTVALLAAAVAAPTMGRLGDGRYRRETIVGGLAIVFVGSIVAGLAHSLGVLIAGRLMQGVGLGLAPVAMAAARDHLPARRGREVIAVLSVMGAAGVGAGYPLSGLLATDLGLHAAFFFGAVLSGILLLACAGVIPSTRRARPMPLDLRGAALITFGLTALLIAIAQGQRWGWTSMPTLGLFGLAIVAFATWVWWQLSGQTPLVDLRQLRHRAVLSADLAALVLGLGLYMFLTLITEMIQEPRSTGYGLGASTLLAGCCLVPFSVISVLASRTTGALIHRAGSSAVMVGGTLITSGTGAFFALLHGSLWEAFVAMGILGVGFGYTFAAIPGLITQAVPESETGSAMGLYQVIRYIGFSVGSALAASLLAAHVAPATGQPLEQGYITAIWVGSAICLLAAATPLLLARGGARADGALPPERVSAIATCEAELATAGLVGIEGEEAS